MPPAILTLVSYQAAVQVSDQRNGGRASFAEAGQSANGAERLQTGSRLSFIQTLPISLLPRIRQVDGVRDVPYANWFGGAYQDPRNQIFSFAVAPNYLDLYPRSDERRDGKECVRKCRSRGSPYP